MFSLLPHHTAPAIVYDADVAVTVLDHTVGASRGRRRGNLVSKINLFPLPMSSVRLIVTLL
jgi:hypothetical protein